MKSVSRKNVLEHEQTRFKGKGVITPHAKLACIRMGLFITCLIFTTLIILPLIWDIISLLQLNPFYPNAMEKLFFFRFVFNF